MSTFILSAFVKGKDIYMSLLSFRFCEFSFFYFITFHIMINNVWVFFFRYFTENTYTDTLTHVTIVCFMFFNCCTNIFCWGVGLWVGLIFRDCKNFILILGEIHVYLIFFSWFVEECWMHTHVGSTKTANSSKSINS